MSRKRKQDNYKIQPPTQYVCSLRRLRTTSSTNNYSSVSPPSSTSSNTPYDITLAYLSNMPSIFVVAKLLARIYHLNSTQFDPQTLFSKLLFVNYSTVSANKEIIDIKLMGCIKNAYSRNYWEFKNKMQASSGRSYKQGTFWIDLVSNALIYNITTACPDHALTPDMLQIVADYLTPNYCDKNGLLNSDMHLLDRWVSLIVVKPILSKNINEMNVFDVSFLVSLIFSEFFKPVVVSLLWSIIADKNITGIYLLTANNNARIIAAINMKWGSIEALDKSVTVKQKDQLINCMMQLIGWLSKCNNSRD